jgi:ferrochelatase
MVGRPDIGVVLLQLGTPAAPTPRALRRYLREFLSDRRVIDLPRVLWLPLLYLVILQTRPRKSAHLYQQVWTPEGSPLAVTSARQAAALEQALEADGGPRVRVVVGMRYGEPSIASALQTFADAGIERVLAFPMYPQYAGATTGSSLERLAEVTGRSRVVPAVRVVPPYYADAGYINALATTARESLRGLPQKPDTLLASFHGLPQRYADAGDPYPDHCRVTTELLSSALGPGHPPVRMTFQSRFGREPWLRPYTDVTLGDLGKAGARAAVMCPGFTADCLETLEEIGLRGAAQFRDAGGRTFHRISCVNDHPAWIDAMAAIARRELSGWR